MRTNKSLTQEELTAIRERVEKATEGPWQPYYEYDGEARVISHTNDYGEVATYMEEDNAAFIAHARQDIPKLLAEIDRLRMHIQARQENCIYCGDSFYVNFHESDSLTFCEDCRWDE